MNKLNVIVSASSRGKGRTQHRANTTTVKRGPQQSSRYHKPFRVIGGDVDSACSQQDVSVRVGWRACARGAPTGTHFVRQREGHSRPYACGVEQAFGISLTRRKGALHAHTTAAMCLLHSTPTC